MAVSVHHGSSSFGPKFEENFSFKLMINDKLKPQEKEEEEESFHSQKLTQEEYHQEEDDNEEEEEEEEEFSFACTNPDGSPISADDIFHNGQIRPFFPLFDRDLLVSGDRPATASASTSTSSAGEPLHSPLGKFFFEEPVMSSEQEQPEEPEGPFCEWRGKAAKTSPEVCKKSNSTGFSKLRRFREFVLRSNSDGKDAFIFLNRSNSNNNNNDDDKGEKKEKEVAVKEKGKQVVPIKNGKKKGETVASAHEKLYVRSRAMKEEHKRKSYLPYRVGFFTNVNGLSRNVHPY